MTKLTEQDLTNLKWMVLCNDDSNIGFLGPSVRKWGQLPELVLLVRDGLCECRNDSLQTKESGGYWITPAGRTAINMD